MEAYRLNRLTRRCRSLFLLRRTETGQVAIEYALALALVVASLCSMFMAYPEVLKSYYKRVTTQLCKP